MDIGPREKGVKRPLNGVRKCDGQTNRLTHIPTFRLIERIGPDGRFFEKELNCSGKYWPEGKRPPQDPEEGLQNGFKALHKN